MEILVRTDVEGDGVTETDNDLCNSSDAAAAPAEEGSVVILRSNPLILPMVCGLCGSQYATARELDAHLDTHRDGLPIKRGRGRPKGSKTRKVEENEEMMETGEKQLTTVDGIEHGVR